MNLIPASKEKERIMLGLVMWDPLNLERGISINHFCYTDHKKIFQAMIDLRDQGLMVNELTVIENLRETGKYKEGDIETITDLQKDIAYHQHWDEYLKYLEMYRKRRIALSHIERIIAEPEKYNNRKIYQTMLEVEKVISQDGNILSSSDLSEAKTGEHLYTGINQIDEKIYFCTSDYCIIGADPRRGKTSLALSLAVKMQQYHPLFFSAEMGKGAIRQRMICIENDKYLCDLRESIINYKIKSNIHWVFTPAIHTSQIDMQVSEEKNLWGTKVVFIDHIQHLQTDIPRGTIYNRNNFIGKISLELNAIAKKYDVLLIACSQLNRDSERQKEKPGLRCLRDSGSLEADTDHVLLLWEYKTGIDTNANEIIIAKQRQGAAEDKDSITSMKFLKAKFKWE